MTAAAVAANLLESYLGETLQGRAAWINNDALNIIQTCAAAAAAVAGHHIMMVVQSSLPCMPGVLISTAATQWHCAAEMKVM